MAKRRAGVGLAALNGYLYAVGGFDDASPLGTVERSVHNYNVMLPYYNSSTYYICTCTFASAL